MNTLLNILILLAIIYLTFLIIDKFSIYILGIILFLGIVLVFPYIIKFFSWIFSKINYLATEPVYRMTGIRLEIPLWVNIIGIVICIGITLFSLYRVNNLKGNIQ